MTQPAFLPSSLCYTTNLHYISGTILVWYHTIPHYHSNVLHPLAITRKSPSAGTVCPINCRPIESIFLSIVFEMANSGAVNDNFSQLQLIVLCIAARIAAAISGVCAVRMVTWAWQRRHSSSMFHRFQLGMSLHLVNFSAWHVVGSAAIPKGTPYSWGARGTVATCTAQGINVQLSTFSVGFYYMALSIYSSVAVRHNFVSKKYAWMEPWIHCCVHTVPIVSTVYLACRQAFNNGGNSAVCWIDSLPNGCGGDEDVPCTRGPENISQVSMVTAGIPALMILVVPTIVMFCLYRYVLSRHSSILLASRSVAKQSGLYLLALYWSFAFPLVNNSLIKFLDKEMFITSFLSNVNVNLLGVWMLLIYRHFSVRHSTTPNDSLTSTTVQLGASGNTETFDKMHNSFPEKVGPEQPQSPPAEPQSRSRTIDFNIFDGSNATGQFADFVFEGDSDDAAVDAAETEMWADAQLHV